MGYLITQIIICLLIAALIGALIGWWLRKFCCRRDLAILEDDYNLRLRQIEADRDVYKGRCGELTTNLAEWENEAEASGAIASSGVIAGHGASEAAGTGGARSHSGWPYPVEEVEGIGPTYGNRLRETNIETTEHLLEKCCESAQQTEAAKHVKVEPFVVGKWVSMADLLRIPGIRGQYAELLEASGIASVGEMARQEGSALAAKMARINAEEHRTQSVPDTDTVSGWIEAAKGLPSIIKSLVPK